MALWSIAVRFNFSGVKGSLGDYILKMFKGNERITHDAFKKKLILQCASCDNKLHSSINMYQLMWAL